MNLTINLDEKNLLPYQIAIDIIKSIAKDASDRFIRFALSPICELTTTNDWINLESLGKPAAIRAEQLSHQLKPLFESKKITILQLEIKLNHHLTVDNLYFLLFLSDSVDRLEVNFYVNNNHTINDLLANIKILLAKHNVNILFENDNSKDNKQDNVGERELILKNIGFHDLSNHFEAVGYAWVCLKCGAYQLACQSIEDILNATLVNAEIYEFLFMQLQLIRFLSHQYLLVTNEIFPQTFHHLNEEEANNLHFIKAYSATLSRNVEVATIYFNKCNINIDINLTDEKSLFRLNIYALFLVLQNELEKALNLELKIKDYIELHHIDIVGLKYVNYINIARLYKKLEKFDESLIYYKKAYHEISGGYTISDHIYYHINLGGLYEAAKDFHQAVHYWTQAAIYWLSTKNPHALAWRPRLILAQEKLNDILLPLLPEKVNRFFYHKINYLLEKTGKNIENILTNITHYPTANYALSNMILAIDPVDKGLKIQYKRSFMNKTLHADDEVELVKKLYEEKNIQSSSLNETTLINLLKKQVITYVREDY